MPDHRDSLSFSAFQHFRISILLPQRCYVSQPRVTPWVPSPKKNPSLPPREAKHQAPPPMPCKRLARAKARSPKKVAGASRSRPLWERLAPTFPQAQPSPSKAPRPSRQGRNPNASLQPPKAKITHGPCPATAAFPPFSLSTFQGGLPAAVRLYQAALEPQTATALLHPIYASKAENLLENQHFACKPPSRSARPIWVTRALRIKTVLQKSNAPSSRNPHGS